MSALMLSVTSVVRRGCSRVGSSGHGGGNGDGLRVDIVFVCGTWWFALVRFMLSLLMLLVG